MGHNGLMDRMLERDLPARDKVGREVIILGCVSRDWFREPFRRTGATPLLWTTGPMAPEACTLGAALDAWVAREEAGTVRERAAQAYGRYRKCGINGARRLLATAW